jgi:hypothetical protein
LTFFARPERIKKKWYLDILLYHKAGTSPSIFVSTFNSHSKLDSELRLDSELEFIGDSTVKPKDKGLDLLI